MSEDNIIHNPLPDNADTESPKESAFTKKKSQRKKEFSTTENNGERNLWWVVLYLGLIAIFAVLGAYFGLFIARMQIMDIEQEVTNYQQHITTRIIDGSGESTVDELAEERRVLISADQVPAEFVNALIAIEDKDFLSHHGVDLIGIARALVKNILSGRIVQGGSTISQQLIKNLFLTSEQTYKRKIREAILALQLEAKYTKDEIIGFYCNTVYFGHQRYGLEAAARFYFGEPAEELKLHQAALLAGIVRAPERYTPIRYPERAMDRRNLVLQRMVDTGMLTPESADQAKILPLGLRDRKRNDSSGEYFVEEVRRFLVNTFGRDQTLRGGLRVYSTVDLRMQRAAEKALKEGLYELSMRQRMRPVTENVVDEEIALDEYHHHDWDKPLSEGDFNHCLILEVAPKEMTIRVGESTIKVTQRNIHTRMLTAQKRSDLSKVFRVGDVMPVRLDKLSLMEQTVEQTEESAAEEGEEPQKIQVTVVKSVTLSQEPEAEAALVAVEAQTGRVLAMVGGFDFSKNQFNNAIQAKRQTGSAFKPIVACTAIENNRATLASTIFDEPTVFDDPGAPELYEPENYKKSYIGITTVRDILEHSRNIPAIKLMLHAGIKDTVELAQKMGVKEELPAIYSLALGSIEMSLMDLVGVYTTFPNQGVSVEPYMISRITDVNGGSLFEHRGRPVTAMKPSTSFLVTQALIGVFERGTAKSAFNLINKYNIPLAGKTGTTDDYTDAWFVGFSPQIVCGVWVGNKNKVTIGDDESGAMAALPIWKRFMDVALEPEEWRTINHYEIPPNVYATHIDRRNGLLPSEFTPMEEIIIEFFIRGTEPTRSTTYDDDYNLRIQPIRLMEKRVSILFDEDDRVIPRDFYQTNWQ